MSEEKIIQRFYDAWRTDFMNNPVRELHEAQLYRTFRAGWIARAGKPTTDPEREGTVSDELVPENVVVEVVDRGANRGSKTRPELTATLLLEDGSVSSPWHVLDGE